MTDCTVCPQPARFEIAPVRREWMEAAVAAVAFILLLPGASLLLSVVGV